MSRDEIAQAIRDDHRGKRMLITHPHATGTALTTRCLDCGRSDGGCDQIADTEGKET
jgi:hypothetical protein